MARRKGGKKHRNKKPAPQPAPAAQNAAKELPASAPPAAAAPRRSQAQKRAADALEKVLALEGENYGKYRAYVKSLPAKIIMNGLGQALAMEKAKGSDDSKNDAITLGHSHLFAHLDNWLREGWEHSPYRGQGDILQALMDGSEADYIRAQGEALAYVEWLKKFAVAYLKDPEEGKPGEGKEKADADAASQ